MNERSFEEWFHRQYLETFGPVDLADPESRFRHRLLKAWCEAAWLEGRASTYDSTGV